MLEGEDRIVMISGFEIDRLTDWITDPPYAPTPTPEVTETPEALEEPGDDVLGPAGVPPEEGEGEDSDQEGESEDGGGDDTDEESAEPTLEGEDSDEG
jgi:hypothetical protein